MSESKNKNLRNAKSSKKDEFYTQLSDIENELKHYKEHFKDKVVYCNCDDPRVSNFFHYFSFNFEKLQLKKLIATCYKSQSADLFSQNDSERAIYLEYMGGLILKNSSFFDCYSLTEGGSINLKFALIAFFFDIFISNSSCSIKGGSFSISSCEDCHFEKVKINKIFILCSFKFFYRFYPNIFKKSI